MIWILVGIAASLMTATRESLNNHLKDEFTTPELGFLGSLHALMFLVIATVSVNKGPIITDNFSVLATAAISGVSVVLVIYLYIESLRLEDISVVSPIKQTNPLFLAFLEPWLLNFSFNPTIIIGALLSSIGAYILVVRDSFFKPITNLRNKGALLALSVALVYALTSVAQRFGNQRMDPLVFALLTNIVAITGFIIWIKSKKKKLPLNKVFRGDLVFLGAVIFLAAFLTFYGYSIVSASELTVVKQLSGIFAILIGGRFFDEKDIARKLVGGFLIIAGVAFVIL